MTSLELRNIANTAISSLINFSKKKGYPIEHTYLYAPYDLLGNDISLYLFFKTEQKCVNALNYNFDIILQNQYRKMLVKEKYPEKHSKLAYIHLYSLEYALERSDGNINDFIDEYIL